MSAYTNEEKQLAAIKARYGKYEADYNATFAADPVKQDRKFDELAPPDAKQWSRLETYRGNDRDARAAYLDHPNSSTQPTPKEQRMWDANQAEHWAIDRPADMYLDAPGAKNKWLDMSQDERRSERSQKFFEVVEEKYGPSYEKWADRAGSNVVAKDTYLQGLAVVAHETVSGRQQHAQQTQVAQPTTPTRVSPADFSSAEQFVAEKTPALSKMDIKQLDGVMEKTSQAYRAEYSQPLEEGVKQTVALNDLRLQQEANRTRQAEPVAQRERSRGLER